MFIALAGIGGTLFAGLGGTYLGARMEREAEGRREEIATRRAARLIDADLLAAETAARFCVERKKWWPNDVRLTSEGWQLYRDVIASKLPWDDWVAVVVAVSRVGDLQGLRDSTHKIELAKVASTSAVRKPGAEAEHGRRRRRRFRRRRHVGLDMPDSASGIPAEAFDLDIAEPAPAMPESTATQFESVLVQLVAGRAALAPLTRGKGPGRRR